MTVYTVRQLARDYCREAEKVYRKNGKVTSSVFDIRCAMKRLSRFCGSRPAESMDAPTLKRLVRRMVWGKDRQGGKVALSRRTVNGRLRIIRDAFAWARTEGTIPASVVSDLGAVRSLRRNQTKAAESSRVLPVADELVLATMEKMKPGVRAMVQLQLLTGMRPGEVIIMRPCDIDRTGEVWMFKPHSWKTEHLGIPRIVAIGPKAQEVLRPFIENRKDTAYLFDPRDGYHYPAKAIGKRYTVGSYRVAIHRACRRANVDEWNPNQLRHNAATAMRKAFGIEAARVTLGHTDAGTTEIYAEADRARAIEVAMAAG